MNTDWIIRTNQIEDVLDLLNVRALELQPLHGAAIAQANSEQNRADYPRTAPNRKG